MNLQSGIEDCFNFTKRNLLQQGIIVNMTEFAFAFGFKVGNDLQEF